MQSVVQSIRDKLSADIIIKQTVSLSPEIVLEENTDIEAWDAVIEITMIIGKVYRRRNQSAGKTCAGRNSSGSQDASPFPVYHGSAKMALVYQPLMDAGDRAVPTDWGTGAPPHAAAVEYTDCGQRRVYLRLYSGTLRLRDTVALAGRKAENHRDAYSIQRGNCSDRHRLSG